jgi:hypothetical protein
MSHASKLCSHVWLNLEKCLLYIDIEDDFVISTYIGTTRVTTYVGQESRLQHWICHDKRVGNNERKTRLKDKRSERGEIVPVGRI